MENSLYNAVQSKEQQALAQSAVAPDKVACEQYDLFTRAYQSHRQWVLQARKQDEFYVGDQWSSADAKKLTDEGRPFLTINLILSTVNVVVGDQITGRLGVQYKPRMDASADSAFALTKLGMSILEANNYRWLETAVFLDGLIMDRGYFDIRMDWSKSVNGTPVIRDLDPCNVIPDQEAKNWDPETWNEVWYTEWVSLDHVAVNYGEEMAAKLRSVAFQGEHYGTDSIVVEEQRFGENRLDQLPSGTGPEAHRVVRSVRLIERQYRVATRIHYLVDPSTGQRRPLPPDTPKEVARRLAEQHGLLVQSVTEQRIRWRVTCDRFTLHDTWSPYKSFTIVPFFPYFRRGKPFGMVRNLISPQEQFNKLASQELHIINSTANSGWIVEQGALHGMTTDDLARQGAKTGLVVTVNPGKLNAVDKITPNSVPTGIDRLSTKSQQNIDFISGVNPAMRGFESAEVSGVAIEKKTDVGAVQLAVVKDSLARTRHMLARRLLELMQDYMQYELELTYTSETPTGEQKDETITLNQRTDDGGIVNSVAGGKYDIVISTMPERDVFREVQFAEALAMRNVGVQIPDYHIVRYSNLEDRLPIADEIKQLSGLGDVPPEVAEYNRRMREVELAEREAAVAKNQGQAQQATSQAQLNSVKAQNEALAPEFRQRDAEREWASTRLGHDIRERLALIQAGAKLDATVLNKRIPSADKATGNGGDT